MSYVRGAGILCAGILLLVLYSLHTLGPTAQLMGWALGGNSLEVTPSSIEMEVRKEGTENEGDSLVEEEDKKEDAAAATLDSECVKTCRDLLRGGYIPYVYKKSLCGKGVKPQHYGSSNLTFFCAQR